MATTKTTTKVFVGNLSFKTTQEDLKRAFESIGKVANANIITRGTRSLGYGFVEFASEDDANKAVHEMNKKKVDEREINVEIAKPRDESKPPRSNMRGGGGGGGGYRVRGFNRGRGGYNMRGYGRRGGGYSYGYNPRRMRPRPFKKVNPDERTQSTTTLFVANLPYKLEDDDLKGVFNPLSVKSSKVIRRNNGRSKGFGFVEFNSEDDQKKALALSGKAVEGRELVIKVAFSGDPSKDMGVSPPPITTTTTTTTTPTATTTTSTPKATTPTTSTNPPAANKTPAAASKK